ncbi:TonB-linked SusC/RagA family outer membrane protein [Acetobacteroides hydrogenigenes]|uniref:TonB-linked SusC/RagA family outer membrane protein n=1 Tax=Acetobacteroides hydrogenigenes TaxID=979970 RepID=A0A4V2RNR4_9BACT|nr:TonB-linked SusC/RagA family outer membrane protein [Acetobacteroides hydrogenigenes]
MRRFLSLLVMVLVCVGATYAQPKQVTGRVFSSEDKSPIPGVSVFVKEASSIGTTTNIDGQFTLKNIPANAKTLVFRFVGFQTQEVNIREGEISVTLVPETQKIDEVVVTAMGMKRDRKALGYAVQDIKAEAITRAGSSAVGTALQGKLAGVEIKPSSGMPGASTNITIRGARSFTGNNAPLYIIDGMPIASNADYSTGNSVTGTDVANRAVDIDPNDIESINVLKGQAAAALYGIRASNGVVIITTKSGKNVKGSKAVITFSTNYSADLISRKPEMQSTWAQGAPAAGGGYSFNPYASTNWGPKIADLPNDKTYGGNVANANNGNNASKYPGKYYVPQLKDAGYEEADRWVTPQVYNNVDDFFKTGYTLNNSFNISQAMEKGNYSFGVSNTTQEGIVPSTSMDRYTAKAAAEIKVANSWKTGFSTNYAQTYIMKAPGANDGLVATVFSAPRNYNLKGIPYASPTDPYYQILYRATNFNNPYWAINNNKFDEKTNRFYGNSFVEYSPNIFGDSDKKLNFKYQLGMDSYSTHFQDINEYKSKNTLGSINNYGITATTYNSLLTVTFDMNITKDIKFNLLLGNEINQENNKTYSESGSNFNFGGWAHINNATIKNTSENQSRSRTVGFFGNLSLSYRDLIYLNATGRQDVVSTMPRGNRTFFYPSVSLGFVLTELEALKGNSILSFAKLRASYAEVGQAGRYYENYYVTPSYSGGFWTGNPIQYPLSGVTAYIPNTTQYDPNLKPQNTVSFEVGADLRFFNNLFGIDYTFSRQDVKDQIFDVPLAGSTGASALTMNGGAIYTNAHEVVVSINPIRQKDLEWSINVNFTKMDNYVKELAEGVESIFLGGFTTPQVRAGVGSKFPVIYGSSFKKDAQGRILVDERATINGVANPYYGFPMQGKPDVIGSAAPDFTLGASTTLRYKRITISSTIDWKKGGQMYHGTNGLLSYTYGLAKSTEDRTSVFVYPGFKADGTPNDIQRGGSTDQAAYYNLYANTLGNIDEAFIFNNSYVKLRELTLSYRLPKIKGIDINVTGFARNILIWTNLPNFDPEATQGNTNMGGAFERFTTPQSMSFGMGLNFVF